MCLKLYTFLLLLIFPTTSHKVPIFFTKLLNSDTHLTDLNNPDQNLQPGIEFQHPPSTILNNSGTTTSTNNVNNNTNNGNITTTNNNDVNNDAKIGKKELSGEAYKLNEELKNMDETKDKMKELEKTEEELSEKLRDTNYEKLSELVKQRNLLLNKISEIGKTLRKEHDTFYPELRDQPIILIAKSSQDDKRKANQLAHLQGFEDVMNRIASPCNLMEELREKSVNKKDDMMGKYEREQKVLDSMNWKERLNYDNNMIEHYESIMSEIEEGIRRAEEEIENSWNQFIH